MARKVEGSGGTKRSHKERVRARAEKIREGLQKELDTLVPPISLKKEEIPAGIKARAEKGAEENRSEVPEKKSSAPEEPVKEEEVKKKVVPWAIVIGETD